MAQSKSWFTISLSLILRFRWPKISWLASTVDDFFCFKRCFPLLVAAVDVNCFYQTPAWNIGNKINCFHLEQQLLSLSLSLSLSALSQHKTQHCRKMSPPPSIFFCSIDQKKAKAWPAIIFISKSAFAWKDPSSDFSYNKVIIVILILNCSVIIVIVIRSLLLLF